MRPRDAREPCPILLFSLLPGVQLPQPRSPLLALPSSLARRKPPIPQGLRPRIIDPLPLMPGPGTAAQMHLCPGKAKGVVSSCHPGARWQQLTAASPSQECSGNWGGCTPESPGEGRRPGLRGQSPSLKRRPRCGHPGPSSGSWTPVSGTQADGTTTPRGPTIALPGSESAGLSTRAAAAGRPPTSLHCRVGPLRRTGVVLKGDTALFSPASSFLP